MGAELSLPSPAELSTLPLTELYVLLVDNVENDQLDNVIVLTNLRVPKLNVNMRQGQLVTTAAGRGFTKLLEYFLTCTEADVRLVDAYNTVNGGQIECLKILLKHGFDLTAPRNEKLLEVAVKSGDITMVHYLLEHGINPNGNHRAALKTALKKKDTALIHLLFQYGAEQFPGQKKLRQWYGKTPDRAAFID